MGQLSRRALLKAGLAIPVMARTAWAAASPVYLIRTTDRAEGIRRGLRMHGGNATISRGRVFEQEQIARAVQLGLGARGPEQIDLVSEDPESRKLAERVRHILMRG